MFCCSAKEETWELVWRKGGVVKVSLLVSLSCSNVPSECLLVFETGILGYIWGRKVGRKVLIDLLGISMAS